MPLKFLSDFTKRTTDLWKEKYFEFHKTLEVNVDSGNKVSWKGKHQMKAGKGPCTELTMNQREKGLGELELKIDSNENIKLTLKSKELMDNLAVEAKFEGPQKNNVKLEYQGNDKWAGKLDVKMVKESISMNGAASFAYENGTIGVDGVVDMDGSLQQYNVGVRLDQDKDRTYALQSKNKLQNLDIAFYYNVNQSSSIGAQVGVDMTRGNIDLRAAGHYDVDSQSRLRYGLTSAADLSLAYEYTLNDRVKGFVGTKYNLSDNKMCADGLGYKLVFDC